MAALASCPIPGRGVGRQADVFTDEAYTETLLGESCSFMQAAHSVLWPGLWLGPADILDDPLANQIFPSIRRSKLIRI